MKSKEDGDSKHQPIGVPAVVAEGIDKEVGERFKKWAASKSTINNDGRRWTKVELTGGGSGEANISDEFRHSTWKYDYRVDLDYAGHPEGESSRIAGYIIIFLDTREDRYFVARGHWTRGRERFGDMTDWPSGIFSPKPITPVPKGKLAHGRSPYSVLELWELLDKN